MEEQGSRLPEQHPEDAALREEIARLRASLTALLLQKDELLMVQCRRIEAAYLRRFGPLEVKVYERWCACLRAKKKARLIRASSNRRRAADLPEIEAELDRELSGYRQELENRFQRVAGAMERREGPGLSQKGRREMKELYRRAVKALHPDLNPEEDEAQLRTLAQAVRAYQSGDLQTLRDICDSLAPAQAENGSTLEELRQEAKRLRHSVRELDAQLEEIKSKYPYNARPYLENEELGKAHEAELREKLGQLRDMTTHYEEQIARMLDPEPKEGDTE